MVKLILGHNGTGKTKRMLEMANEEVDNIQGKMVFIEANNKHIYDIKHKIRYINTKEYGISNEELFHGFVCGMLATDYDIEKVFIDGLYKITNACDADKVEAVINRLDALSEKFEVDFVLSLNFDEENAPEFLKNRK